ncbi:TetR/AcrR family transcriptional regulator [Kitasatospora sp. NPDC096147]|uniref:TetR/AcrR family transcriptional regulator n=1 Tax=Kitasatospora sp. NPDC096147 TaxID=3364093 RepID=UPI0037FB3504
MEQQEAPARPRNRRGEGTRLREEIVRAAIALIEREGSKEAVTLRAVAREVGIAAPSIYGHFPDREAVVEAVVAEALDRLNRMTTGARDSIADPVDALLAGCAAYVEFGTREPACYRIIFGSAPQRLATGACRTPASPEGPEALMGLVRSLETVVAAGRSASTDPFGDAVALWTALHGQVTLRAALPDFPWPPTDTVEQLVRRLGRITDGPLPDAAAAEPAVTGGA